MKRIYKLSCLILPIIAFAFFTTSCEDDSEVFTATETDPITLSELAITSIELDPVNVNNAAVTFVWTQADYGQQASENYSIEISSDEEFTNPVVATTISGNNTVTLSVSELNSAAGNAGLFPFVWETIYARVVSTIGTQDSLPVSSNVISFDVYPYFNYVFMDYYLVGNGTAPGWNNNNNNPPLIRDTEDSQKFNYTGYFDKASADFNEGRFKVLEIVGLWQPQWGVDANEGEDTILPSGSIAGNPGTQSGDPGRFGVETSGYYSFTINFGTKTYTMEPYDASGATEYTSITAQGSALSGDVSLTQLSFDSHLWYANGVDLVPGEIQFTTNTGSIWGSTTEFSGESTENGGSIPVVVEDQYNIWFNGLTGQYIMIPQNL